MAFYKSTDLRVWAADPAGVNAGGWGLTLSPMDLAKLGQLYLDGGNALYVSPDKNLVAAITSRFQPRVKDRIELIRTYVAPCFV